MDKIYRIQIVIGGFDGEGFWDMFNTLEMSDNKEKLIESLNRIFDNATNYIKESIE